MIVCETPNILENSSFFREEFLVCFATEGSRRGLKNSCAGNQESRIKEI